jgi:predicted Zn-dependent protease
MMQIWTGLLLRCRNEAQLAAVMGHEMGHYLRQHTLERFRDVRAKADFGAFLGLGLAVAGAGAVGTLAQLALLASIFSFSREQEREADAVGLDLMARAGFPPLEASRVWDQLIAERKASPVSQPRDIFFATHPAEDERAETLRGLAQASPTTVPATAANALAYQARLASLRSTLMEDELRLQRYGRSEVVFDGLLSEAPIDGSIWFYKGELYRLRAAEGDAMRAEEAYSRALAAGTAPPEAYRSIGLVRRHAGDRSAADDAFKRYLALRPDAPDQAAIRALISER